MALVGFSVCRDWAFICKNTGARKGHRTWFWGQDTGSWYQQSKLEAFVRENPLLELEHDWVSYAGTGKNFLGKAILHGHGRPGPIVLLKPQFLDEYVDSVDEAEREILYKLFEADDKEVVREKIDQIYEFIIQKGNEPNKRIKTEQ